MSRPLRRFLSPLGHQSFHASLSEVPQPGRAGGSSAWPLRRFLSPLGHRSFDASSSEVPQPRRVGGSSARPLRRFLSPLGHRSFDASSSEVPQPGRVGGSSPPPRPSPSSDLGGSEAPPFSACGPPRVSQSLHTLSTIRRVVNVSLFSGSSARIRMEVLCVKDILRRYLGEGCGHSPTISGPIASWSLITKSISILCDFVNKAASTFIFILHTSFRRWSPLFRFSKVTPYLLESIGL